MTTKRRHRKKKPVEEKRIYVIVPHTVLVTTKVGRALKPKMLSMEPGRLMAQVAHVVSKLRMSLKETEGNAPITTIVLSVRNSRELFKVWDDLVKYTLVEHFRDSNPEFYGTKGQVLTAICTVPVTRSEVAEALGHLELYAPVK